MVDRSDEVSVYDIHGAPNFPGFKAGGRKHPIVNLDKVYDFAGKLDYAARRLAYFLRQLSPLEVKAIGLAVVVGVPAAVYYVDSSIDAARIHEGNEVLQEIAHADHDPNFEGSHKAYLHSLVDSFGSQMPGYFSDAGLDKFKRAVWVEYQGRPTDESAEIIDGLDGFTDAARLIEEHAYGDGKFLEFTPEEQDTIITGLRRFLEKSSLGGTSVDPELIAKGSFEDILEAHQNIGGMLKAAQAKVAGKPLTIVSNPPKLPPLRF